jgi:hypothetical protein
MQGFHCEVGGMEETSGLERTSASRVEVSMKDGPESDDHETCRGVKGRKEVLS